jgi:asparagine synthase (glutamine-hydrolysing)
MSGIVGIINLDGAPVDRNLLEQMTQFMAVRGPDAQQIWIDGHVGFGHTLLRTTDESLHEQQPCSLDGEIWITVDARIDDRVNLINKLAAHGRQARLNRPDVELILHAYHAWGAECVRHLLGDFAFAIWDGRRRRLFCARDHLGIKPFYYAVIRECLVLSNTLNCVRLHPAVSDELNDQAIGDFLLFGGNQNKETTAFAGVPRLPPAHTLEWNERTPRLSRYWDLPVDGEIRYRRASDYVAHFNELFRAAVGDRLRTDRVAVFMSGGLDSSSVAAVACDHPSSRSTPIDVRANTYVFDRLIPDKERHYAGLVAKWLRIQIEYLVADDYQLFERWNEPELHKPEPFEGAAAAALVADHFRAAAAHSRIALTGEGGDPIQGASPAYVFNMLKKARWGRLAADFCHSMRHRRLPKVGFRARLRRWLGTNSPWQFPYPEWLEEGFARRLCLAERLKAINEVEPSPHQNRPDSYRTIVSCDFLNWFESWDAGTMACPLEVRYPYFDTRVVNFFLAIPPVPWCDNKLLVRLAMRGLLPDSICFRPKTPLAGEPVRELLARKGANWVDEFVATDEFNVGDLGVQS